MEPWRKVWREGFAPQMSDAGLEALRDALRGDDSRLRQGCTTVPPPMACVQDWPVEGACPAAYGGWVGDGLRTVGEVEEGFAVLCHGTDVLVREPAGCRHFLQWIDATPRAEMMAALLPEVEGELSRRGVGVGVDEHEDIEAPAREVAGA